MSNRHITNLLLCVLLRSQQWGTANIYSYAPPLLSFVTGCPLNVGGTTT